MVELLAQLKLRQQLLRSGLWCWSMEIRNAVVDDHRRIVEVMVEWWGGRDLSASLLKIFFIHFQNTCFIAEQEHELAGFLVGFFSQCNQGEAYIQFAGVNPQYRREGVGKRLYNEFFAVCRSHSIVTVKSSTSPENTLSILFHQVLGFTILPGDGEINGIEVTNSYLTVNDPKVLFERNL